MALAESTEQWEEEEPTPPASPTLIPQPETREQPFITSENDPRKHSELQVLTAVRVGGEGSHWRTLASVH